METVFVVAHHKNHHYHQYYGRNGGRGSRKFDAYGPPPSGNFRGINCRTFQYRAGLLPTPLKSCSTTAHVAKKGFSISISFSPKTPSPCANVNHKNAKSSTASTPIKMKYESKRRELCFSERWAGLAYSNSPPPSSLPIPKFSMSPKRTVSMELPSMASEIDLHPCSKSAAASPTRGFSPLPSDMFDSHDSAMKTLRCILNLDRSDE